MYKIRYSERKVCGAGATVCASEVSPRGRCALRAVCVWMLWCAFCLPLSAQYVGRVYEDCNRNGEYDAGDKLLRGVSVSDGLHVVQTDAKGTYRLPGHTRMRFVFITTPSGYKTFNAFYRRVGEPTATYDFALYPSRTGIRPDGSHRFIHLSDTEIASVEGNETWSRQLCDFADNEHIAFVMHTGDICYEGGLKSHIKILNTRLMDDTQVFYGIGNHDLVKGAYGEALYEEIYGPVFYSFDVGSVHYVMTPMLKGDHQPGYTKEDVYRWLKNDLAAVKDGRHIVFFNHSIPEDTVTFRYGISPTEYIDLPERGVKYWFYGHWHIHHMAQHPSAKVNLICTATPSGGGIDHATSAFRVLAVDSRGTMTSTLRYTYLPAFVHIASPGGQQAPVLRSGKVPLAVNAYSSVAPVRDVTYRCLAEGRPITPMRPLRQRSDFGWWTEMELPARWAGRRLAVEVQATFTNGEVKKTKRSFLYVPPSEQTARFGLPTPSGETSSPLLRPEWVQQVDASVFMTAPVVQDGKVYLATVDDNCAGKAAMVCLDAASGVVQWKYPVRGSVRSSIAVAQGHVLAQDVYGTLYAVDALTGRLRWERALGIGLLPGLNDGLVARGEVVYAGTGRSLCAVRIADGKLLWRNAAWTRGEGCVATLSIGGDILLGHANWKGLYAHDARTGKLLWTQTDKELRFRSGSATWCDGRFYLLSGRSLYLIDGQTGHIVLRKALGYGVDVNTAPLVTDAEIIFGTAQRGVVALDRATWEEKWNFRTEPARIYTAPYTHSASATVETRPVLLGDVVCIGASDGCLYALDRKSGKPVWKFQTGVPIFSTVAVADGRLFLADFGGNVYGFAWQASVP